MIFSHLSITPRSSHAIYVCFLLISSPCLISSHHLICPVVYYLSHLGLPTQFMSAFGAGFFMACTVRTHPPFLLLSVLCLHLFYTISTHPLTIYHPLYFILYPNSHYHSPFLVHLSLYFLSSCSFSIGCPF